MRTNSKAVDMRRKETREPLRGPRVCFVPVCWNLSRVGGIDGQDTDKKNSVVRTRAGTNASAICPPEHTIGSTSQGLVGREGFHVKHRLLDTELIVKYSCSIGNSSHTFPSEWARMRRPRTRRAV